MGHRQHGLKTASHRLSPHSEDPRLLLSLQGEGVKSSLQPCHLAQGFCVLLGELNEANLTSEGKTGRR